MSITAEELNNIYSNLFDEEYLKNTRALSAGLERFYESFIGSESYKQIQTWMLNVRYCNNIFTY